MPRVSPGVGSRANSKTRFWVSREAPAAKARVAARAAPAAVSMDEGEPFVSTPQWKSSAPDSEASGLCSKPPRSMVAVKEAEPASGAPVMETGTTTREPRLPPRATLAGLGAPRPARSATSRV